MAKFRWQVAAFALLAEPALAAGPGDAVRNQPTLAVRVVESDVALTADLSRAQSIASDIYRRAGVNLRWIADAIEGDKVFTVVITTSAPFPDTTVDAMGLAPSPGDGTRGTKAYAFSDRIIEFADSNGIARSYVLGCVLAHEIGHLLLPANAHSRDGIMRSDWHASLFPPRAPGLPGFLPRQARSLRLRVSAGASPKFQVTRSG